MSPMRRIFLLLAAAAILLAACGGAATVSTTSEELSSDAVPATPAPSADDQSGGDETQTTPADETATDATPAVDDEPVVARVTDFDGPAAADFTIALDKAGTFSLSEETRPVYLVFWAEW